ncbi:MAG: PAS domain S-box protein, partial [Candidatus Fermentibacteraceae bacterium]|nr:PAS domain S-box protein [Candidatus Fermentibacteraceae bacterium]
MKDNLKTKARLIQELEQLRDRINKLQTAGNSNSDRKEPSDKSHLNQLDITDSKMTEEALAYKAMMLDNILRTATDVAIATTDMNLVITYYNPVAEHFFGYTAEEVIGKTVMEIHMKENVSPDRLERAIDIVRQTGEYKYSLVQETDNGPRYLNSRVSSILNSDGDMVGFCLFSRDVTEKVLSDQILEESTERHRSLVESTADWVWATDLQGSHTFSNGSIKALLGYEVNEILGESAFPLMHPDDLQSSRELVASAVKRKSGWSNVEIRWLHKDGSVRLFESSARPLFDIKGEMTGFSGIDRDITDYKKAQEALRKSEFDMRTLFNAMTDIVFEMDYDGTYINIAPTSPELMFLPPENSIGKTLHQVFPKAEADQFLSFIRRCIDENETISIEYPLVIGERTVWFEGRATPKTKNTVLYIATDITKKKLSEDALRESEERLRALLNAMPDIVCFKDGQGRWLEANESDIRLFQLDGVDFRGKKDSELAEFTPFYSDAFNTCEETDEHAWEAGCITRSEEVIPRPDDSPVVLDVIKVPTFYADGQRKGLVVVGRDITLRKNAEAERERLMMAIEQAAETIVITDPQGIIEYLNPAFEKVTGYSRDEVIGQNPSMLASGEHDLSFYQDMWETLTRGENWAGRIINKKKDGSFYTEEATISPVRDPSGDVINYVAVKRDITIEVKLEEQLRQAQKMEAVGQLAGGVAHDFNNILQVINGYAQLTLAEINKEHSAYEFVREIAKAGDRAQSLVSQLLSFSRRQ